MAITGRSLRCVAVVGCLAAATGCGSSSEIADAGSAGSDLSGGGSGGSAGASTGTGGSGGGSWPETGGSYGGVDASVDVSPDGAGAGGGGGTGGVAGTDGGPGGAAGGRVCNALPAGVEPPFMPVYRIPLRLHRTRSDLGDDQLCRVLEEVNEIWWKQAGVCFEIEAVKTDTVATTGLDFFFERSTPFPNGVTANGVYGGPHEIYGMDKPSLSPAPNPSRELAARTCAHELGHGLSLGHQNPGEACLFQGTECDDLLMRSGHRGYKVIPGTPANVNEVDRARTRAKTLALPQTDAVVCGPPRLLP
ncbi:MAG TPA: hypothetical protein VFH73_19585 [Polyangia bacterium]|nr:hypothetical protein [Polyangia bacterium]